MSNSRRDPTSRFSPMRGTQVPVIPDTTKALLADPSSLAAILPPALLQDQPTMLTTKYGEINSGVQQLCVIANRAGRRYGVHGEPYDYRAVIVEAGMTEAQLTLALVKEISANLLGRNYLQITRTNSIDWMIFHVEEPGMMTASKGARTTMTPVSDCSVEVKRICLRHSYELFRRYLEQIKLTSGSIDTDLIAASRVIQQLAAVL